MNEPTGIDGRLDQYRPAIVKEVGVTESERYLASLASRSFLNLWSYPSPYRDQKQFGKGHGKELCDLLVVCGQHIIIFSEKSIAWPSAEINVAWSRWSPRWAAASASSNAPASAGSPPITSSTEIKAARITFRMGLPLSASQLAMGERNCGKKMPQRSKSISLALSQSPTSDLRRSGSFVTRPC